MGEAREFLKKLQVEKNTNKLLEEMKTPIAKTDSGDGLYIPNHSGQHDAGTTGTPTADEDIANKKYVDDNAGGFTGTDGSIPFVAAAGTLTEDNASLFWSVGRTQLEPNLIKITSDGTQAAPAFLGLSSLPL